MGEHGFKIEICNLKIVAWYFITLLTIVQCSTFPADANGEGKLVLERNFGHPVVTMMQSGKCKIDSVVLLVVGGS